MLSRELGLVSSWKMLTRDKGWIKPILVLTLIGWIPILGQIAILGYALEWARLTAWGVDAAPKQRGVNYSKVLTTGGVALLVVASMAIAVVAIDILMFGGNMALLAFILPAGGVLANVADLIDATGFGVFSLLGAIFNMCASTFITAAALRSTIYDSFTAGWRLDRLMQMVARDPGGFMHVLGVRLITGMVSAVYAFIVSLIGVIVLIGGVSGLVFHLGGAGMMGRLSEEMVISSLLGAGPALVLVFVLFMVLFSFIGGVIVTIGQLININAMGQWFCRFEVDRWGVSSAPIPDGVPVASGSARPAPAESEPARPEAPVNGVPCGSVGTATRDGGEPSSIEHFNEAPAEDAQYNDGFEQKGCEMEPEAIESAIPLPPVPGVDNGDVGREDQ